MSFSQLPVEYLPTWMHVNDVSLFDVKVGPKQHQGNAVVAQSSMSTKEETFDLPVVSTIPHDLILNDETVEQYAKEDRNFRQLLDVIGHQV
jgi:hypothetical protein